MSTPLLGRVNDLILDIRMAALRSSSAHTWALPALPEAPVHGTQAGKMFPAGEAAAARWKEAVEAQG